MQRYDYFLIMQTLKPIFLIIFRHCRNFAVQNQTSDAIINMIYPQNFEQKIGFDQIRQLLKNKCLSTLGEERVDDMAFSDNYTDINRWLEQVSTYFLKTYTGRRLIYG